MILYVIAFAFLVIAIYLALLVRRQSKDSTAKDEFIFALLHDHKDLEEKNQRLRQQNSDLEHSIGLLHREVERLEQRDVVMKSPSSDEPLFHLKGDTISLG